jgi:hypothetical protein
LYANWSAGFLCNGARGVVINVDPSNPAFLVSRATPLLVATGDELGAQQNWEGRLSTTVALWALKLNAELLFVGDAGTTLQFPSSRPCTRRMGLKFWF